MSNWISVNDELPKHQEWVLISTDCNMPHERVVTMAFFERENGCDPVWLAHNDSNRMRIECDEWDKVTHWQPPPSPPEDV